MKKDACDPEAVRSALLRASHAAGKTYAFDETHDETRVIDHWFQESNEGLILFVVFYTLACRWSACTGCNLPSVSAHHAVSYFSLVRQIDRLMTTPKVAANTERITKLIVSNNGSVLDEATFPSTALMHLLVQVNLCLPALRVISFESRPEYVDLEELAYLARAMNERRQPAQVEIAIGFEAYSEHIRNEVFRKGLSLEAFESLVERMTGPRFKLKCYFMQKPVAGISDEQAIADLQQAVDYLHKVSVRSGLHINLHLNPTYVARGTPLETAFAAGTYAPPQLRDVARVVLYARDKAISIFVGLNDEGLAVPGGSFLRPGDEALARALEAFNRSQDHDALERWFRQHATAV
ncbi:hypothetical protein ACFL5O_11840 [Myxococcota bacterium]